MTWVGTRGEDFQRNSIKHAWYDRGADLVQKQSFSEASIKKVPSS